MKVYHGNPPQNENPALVTVRQGNENSRVLAHHIQHSPDGFNWGYGGSAPSELARCILFDAFGTETCPDRPGLCKCHSPWVDSYYQAYNSDVIAKMTKGEVWKLRQIDICNWVFDAANQPLELVEEVPVG